MISFIERKDYHKNVLCWEWIEPEHKLKNKDKLWKPNCLHASYAPT